MSLRLNPLLVQSQPGYKPGHLQQVDEGNADGGTHAEGLQPGHECVGPKSKGQDICHGGDGDGDPGMLQGPPDLLRQGQGGSVGLEDHVVPALHDDEHVVYTNSNGYEGEDIMCLVVL